jgi:NDP-sugar pyrophosphorylase family protein
MMSQVIRHALIMAAGRGLRMGPMTEVIPKPMVPYLSSTLIGEGISRLRPHVERIHVTVGYKGAVLAQHLIERDVDSVLSTEGHGNAWWISHTLLRTLDEPIFVLTCDNVTDIDLASLAQDYFASGAPPCMLVPVRPVPGVEGDYIVHDDRVVKSLSRTVRADVYASGIQILNPARLCHLGVCRDHFCDVWNELIAQELLLVSRVQPKHWLSVDTLSDLERLRELHD